MHLTTYINVLRVIDDNGSVHGFTLLHFTFFVEGRYLWDKYIFIICWYNNVVLTHTLVLLSFAMVTITIKEALAILCLIQFSIKRNSLRTFIEGIVCALEDLSAILISILR